ncbi:MAG TPA: hypothetical protein VLK29_12905 [Luteimonas sp.]|nr:hypothetical protein [Luteimonas sp.]
MSTFFRNVLLSSVAVASLGGGTAAAVTRDLAFQSNGTGVCQAALPAYEGLIRKRPMAIQNEGSDTAFVTCSPVTLQNQTSVDFGHGIFLVNNSAATVTINCTAVVGAQNGVPQVSIPKSVVISANSSSELYWSEADGVPQNNSTSFNTSCALLPETGITTLYTNQVLDVGQ